MVLNLPGMRGLFGSRNALIRSNQDFVSIGGYDFVGRFGVEPTYLSGRVHFSSGGTFGTKQLNGRITLPNNVTVTRVIMYGQNGAGADIQWYMYRMVLEAGFQENVLGGGVSVAINTAVHLDLDIENDLYTYQFYVVDANATDTSCRVHGVIIEFERRKK